MSLSFCAIYCTLSIGQQKRGCQQQREPLFSMGFAHITTSFEMENPLIREESGRLM